MKTNLTTFAESGDAEIVALVQAGERDAFAELVRRHEPRIRGYCRYMLKDFAAAEDAAQEVFIKAFLALGAYRGEASFSTWLYRIAMNHCCDLARKKRYLSFFIDRRELTPQLEIGVARDVSGSESTLIAKQTLSALLQCLSEKDRSLILLREAYGLSYQELMEVSNSTEESVRSRLKRARKKLLAMKETLDLSVALEGESNAYTR